MIGLKVTAPWELIERDDVPERLQSEEVDVVVTFGAGNIDVICGSVAEVLKTRA
jgi:UDP-N-acetylmuramate-alanine ligase